LNRGQQEGAQLDAQHAAFMNSCNAEGAARNEQLRIVKATK
jgi:hypothetical protein